MGFWREAKSTMKILQPIFAGKGKLFWGFVFLIFLLNCNHKSKPEDKTLLRVKITTSEKSFAYGLGILAPWEGGGSITLSLPEHLMWEHNDNSILDYRDFNSKKQWQVSLDGSSAVLSVESPTAPGVKVEGRATVVARDQVEITMEIINNGKIDLKPVKTLYCCHFAGLSGFPQKTGNLPFTFICQAGKMISLDSIATQDPETQVKGTIVAGNPYANEWDTWWSRRHKGDFLPGVDAAITSITSLDGKRKLIYAWTPGKSMFSNGHIPCIHADPYYGIIKPGESVKVQGLVLFTEKALAEEVARLIKEGKGAPPT